MKEEINVTTLEPKVIYSILDSLREIDPAGSKSSEEVLRIRRKVAAENNLTDKAVGKLCRVCKTSYKNNSIKIHSLMQKGDTVTDAVKKCGEENYGLNLAAFVFWENYEVRKMFPGRNVVKFSKPQRQEIFDI